MHIFTLRESNKPWNGKTSQGKTSSISIHKFSNALLKMLPCDGKTSVHPSRLFQCQQKHEPFVELTKSLNPIKAPHHKARRVWRIAKPMPGEEQPRGACWCLSGFAHPLACLCKRFVWMSLPVMMKTEELCLCLDTYSLSKCYLKKRGF